MEGGNKMNKRQLKLTDYEGFTEEFKPKKTTDDCYTPQAYYDAVVEYVNQYVTPLQGREIVRPFWPGGDYERHDYPQGCIVIDNPPFSIEADIIRFYMLNKIDFFLFCNGLTATNYKSDVCVHIINKGIVFENGANVNVGFVTNIKNGSRIVIAGAFDAAFAKIRADKESKAKPGIVYPRQVVSAALPKKYVCKGVQYSIPDEYAVKMASADKVFGGGYLVPSRIVDDMERELEREQNKVVKNLTPAAVEVMCRLDEKYNAANASSIERNQISMDFG